MAISKNLSVRLNPQARGILAEAAVTHDLAGASALAREILERWAFDRLEAQTQADVQRATTYLRAHPDGWNDDPADFFPGIAG